MWARLSSNRQLYKHDKKFENKKFQQLIVDKKKTIRSIAKKRNFCFNSPITAICGAWWDFVDEDFLLHEHNTFIRSHWRFEPLNLTKNKVGFC
jgi:hypothetical protein